MIVHEDSGKWDLALAFFADLQFATMFLGSVVSGFMADHCTQPPTSTNQRLGTQAASGAANKNWKITSKL